LYFLGNFHKSQQGEIFTGLILKNDDSPVFFKGSASLTKEELKDLSGSFITKNPEYPYT
jgi:hypothetical protein